MKNYHIVSIAALLGLVAGLALPTVSHANTLTCVKTVGEINGKTILTAPVVVETQPHKAVFLFDGESIPFSMNRVINEGWKKEGELKLYQGVNKGADKGEESELMIVTGDSDGVTIQYSYKTGKPGETLTIIGLNCTNAK
ncbi:hypothetical protein MPS38_003036 [Salmonella enterica]|nr:hypothetical protein [Salmonella enterica]